MVNNIESADRLLQPNNMICIIKALTENILTHLVNNVLTTLSFSGNCPLEDVRFKEILGKVLGCFHLCFLYIGHIYTINSIKASFKKWK